MTKEAFDASGVLGELLRGIKGTGSAAESAAQKTLGTASAVKEMGSAATGAVASLNLLESASEVAGGTFGVLGEGAAAAGKSVSGLGRAAASAAPRVEALSRLSFDPARIVAGVDAGVAALGRLKAVAASMPAAMRLASSAAPVFGGSGGIGAVQEGRRGTFGGGVRAGAGAALDIGGAGAMLTTLLAGVSGKLAVSFDNLLQGIRGNTTMTASDAAAMRSQVLALMKTGTDEKQLAAGYMHIQNFGYKGRDAAQIAAEGNRFAIATHGNAEETDDVLAGILNALKHLSASNVDRIANTVHFAAADSNMTISQLEKNSTRTVGLAANYMGPQGLPDALAAYSALVQHRMSPARADTQVSGMLGQIAAPSDKAFAESKRLGLKNFDAEGLKRVNLSGVIEEVKNAIDKLSVNDQASALKQLFNNKQGGTGASFLTGAASNSYHQILNDPNSGTKAAFDGKLDAISPLYNQQMKQTQQAFAALAGEIKADFIPIGQKIGPLFTAAIPVVRETANILKTLLDGFARLPQPAQEAIIAIGGLKIISGFLPMLGGFGLLTEKTTALLGGMGKMLMGIAPEAAEGGAALSGPFLLGIGAVAVAVAGLSLAWKTDFMGIRETTAQVGTAVKGFIDSQFGYVFTFFQSNLPLLRETVKTVLSTIQQFWRDHGSRVMAIISPMWDFIKTTFSAALHIILDVIKFGLDVLTGHWGAAARDIGGIVTNLWAVVKSLFVNGVKVIGNVLAGIVEIVLDVGKRLFEGALNLGQQIINGLISGIKSGFSAVGNAVKDLAVSAITAAKTALDINSPSRKMHEIGQWTAQGLADGLRDGTITVTQAADALGTAVNSHVKGKLTESQKELRTYTAQMGKELATLSALRSGKDATAAATLGQFHDVPGAAALASIKDQIVQIKLAETQQRSFNTELAKTKAALAEIMAGGGKRDVQVAHRFNTIPQGQRDHLAALKSSLDAIKGLDKLITDPIKHAQKTAAQIVTDSGQAFAQTMAAAVAKVKETSKVIKDFNAEMDAKVTAAQNVIAGNVDPVATAWQDYLANHGALADAISTDAAKAGIEFSKFKAALDVDQQATGISHVRDMLSDIAKSTAQIQAKSAFGAFKAGQSVADGMGGIKLPPGITGGNLLEVFKQQKLLDKINLTKQAVGQMVTDISGVIEGGLNGIFENGFQGFFSNIESGFEKLFQNIAVQYLESAVMNSLLGAIGGTSMQAQFGSGGGGGGILGAIFGARAAGGPVTAGMPYLVGEKGPEIIVPGSSGMVIPNNRLAMAGGGRGNDTIHNYNINVTVPSSGGNRDVDRRSGQQVAQAALEEMQRTQRRNGK